MKSVIKPCPFCGDVGVDISTAPRVYTVECQGCGALGPKARHFQEQEGCLEAIELWNARVPLENP